MRIIEKTIFQYSELSESAKQNAREWYRRAADWDNFYAENVFDCAAEMADVVGIDLRQTRKTKTDGSIVYTPTIYYSGFWSQGDGACFEGTYRFRPQASKLIRNIAPQDKELHRIVDELKAIQKKHFYALRASCNHSGRYYHSGCMRVDVTDSRDESRSIGSAGDDIHQCMRDFADWIYKQLQSEYEFSNSDENVAENIIINEYEFDENGNIQ